MEQFKTPPPLSLTANPADNWCSWEQGNSDILVHTIGEDELEVLKVEQLLPDRLHIKEEPEMLSEGQEENQLCFQQEKNSVYLSVKCEDEEEKPQASQLHWRQLTEINIKEESKMLSEGQEEKQLCVQQKTNSAACSVKCEDEEEKPQTSQLHWRQLTEMNIKEEPSTYSLNELMNIQTVGINSKEPESAQNPDQSSLVLQGPDRTETDSSQTENGNTDDEDCRQKPLSMSETDSTKKNRKMSDSIKKSEMGRKASKRRISSCQQICSKRKVQVKIKSECMRGKKASFNAASKLKINSGEKPFKCDVCSKCFSHKFNLQSHVKMHKGEGPFKCDVCGKCFVQEQNLQSHMKMHTGEKPFKCDVCSKSYKQETQLKSHMKVHKGEKPFKCDVCSKCFIQKSYLKLHMRTHSGENRYKCDVCSKCFIQKSDLDKHLRIHTGEKPFKCDVCTKCFIQKPHLQLHMRIHTGEKPFKCDVCSESFTRKAHLQKHARRHKGEKPFKCGVCSESFTCKAHLQSHVKMHKGENQVMGSTPVEYQIPAYIFVMI